MRCIVFTLTLALSHQGRGDLVGCVGLLLPRTSAALWIPACAGMTVMDARVVCV